MNELTTGTQLPFPKAVSKLPENKTANTNGWDTVFAIGFNDANKAITNSWSKVSDKAKNISAQKSDMPSFKLNGVFGPWQLTLGGGDQNIRMVCPFISGTYKADTESYDLTGYEVVIQVGMQWVPDPNQFAFSIDDNNTVNTIKNDLNKGNLDAVIIALFKKNGKTLSSSATASVLNKNQDWVITDGKVNYYIFYYTDKFDSEFLQVYQFEDSWRNNLKILEESGKNEGSAVDVVNVRNNKTEGIAAYILEPLLSDWFNSNIGEFNYVFSALDLSPNLSKSEKFHWLKPTGTSYGVIDNGTIENSVFGVLTMAQGKPVPTGHQVSQNAIPSGDSINAGFLISGNAFMKNMMLAGARALFNNAPESSFDINNEGLAITNNKKIVWGRFKKDKNPFHSISSSYASELDNNQLPEKMVADLKGQWVGNPHGGGSYVPGIMVEGFSAHMTQKGMNWYLSSSDEKTVYLLEVNPKDDTKIDMYTPIIVTIEANQFSMTLEHSYLEIQFIDLVYPENFMFDVNINHTEKLSLGIKEIRGKNYFYFDNVTKNMEVSVTKTKAAVTAEIITDCVLGVIGLISVVAPVVSAISDAFRIVEVTEEVGDAVLTVEEFSSAMSESSSEDILANEESAIETGTEQVRGGWTAFKNAITASRWKAFGGMTAALTGILTVEEIPNIMEAITKGDWEKVPSFDEFANTAISPFNWPQVDSYTLKSAGLANSLQIGLESKSSNK